MKAPAMVIRAGPGRASLAAAGLGAVMLGVAAGFTPAAWPAAAAGGIALLGAIPGRWPAAATAAAAAAMVTSGIGIADETTSLAEAAAEGTVILAYLLAADHAESRLTTGTPRWAARRVPVLAAGFAAALVTAAVAATVVPGSAWLAMAGVAAAGAALLAAAV